MGTTTSSARTAVKARLVELLAARLPPDVQVSYGWPGADMRDEAVWVGACRGPVTVADLRAGRKTRDDTFTLDVHFMAGRPGQTAQTADERVEELYWALEDLLADDPTLGGVDGLRHAAQLGGDVEFEGPQATSEGFVAFATARITVKTRLS
jgi:hypothetical protein